jgi:hypothetical protein
MGNLWIFYGEFPKNNLATLLTESSSVSTVAAQTAATMLLLLLLLLGLALPAAVDVNADAPNPDVSRNHDVHRFYREWSCFEGQANVKRMVRSSLHCWSRFSLRVAQKFFGVLCFRKSTFLLLSPPVVLSRIFGLESEDSSLLAIF